MMKEEKKKCTLQMYGTVHCTVVPTIIITINLLYAKNLYIATQLLEQYPVPVSVYIYLIYVCCHVCHVHTQL